MNVHALPKQAKQEVPPGFNEYACRTAIRDLIAEVGVLKAEFVLSNILHDERERAAQ